GGRPPAALPPARPASPTPRSRRRAVRAPERPGILRAAKGVDVRAPRPPSEDPRGLEDPVAHDDRDRDHAEHEDDGGGERDPLHVAGARRPAGGEPDILAVY